MIIYHCWITALTSSYQDGIIAGMVKKGYMVGPSAKDGTVVSKSSSDRAAVLFAIGVYKVGEVTSLSIYNDLAQVLADMQAYFYSIVISNSLDASWAGANFDLPLDEENEEVLVESDNKKNMN